MISFFRFSLSCVVALGRYDLFPPSKWAWLVGGWRQSFYHPSNRPYWPHWLLRRRLRRGGILFNSPLDCIFRGPYQLVVDQAGQVDFKYWKGDQSRVEQLSVTQKSNSYEFCSERKKLERKDNICKADCKGVTMNIWYPGFIATFRGRISLVQHLPDLIDIHRWYCGQWFCSPKCHKSFA